MEHPQFYARELSHVALTRTTNGWQAEARYVHAAPVELSIEIKWDRVVFHCDDKDAENDANTSDAFLVDEIFWIETRQELASTLINQMPLTMGERLSIRRTR